MLITSRTEQGAREAVASLREEVGPGAEVHGCACDVGDVESVEGLAAAARNKLGHVDVWVNNAGYCSGFQVRAGGGAGGGWLRM